MARRARKERRGDTQSTQKESARMLRSREQPFSKERSKVEDNDSQEGAPEFGEVEIFIVSSGMGQGGKDLGAGPKAA